MIVVRPAAERGLANHSWLTSHGYGARGEQEAELRIEGLVRGEVLLFDLP